MPPNSTLYHVIEQRLNEQGTSFTVLVPDLLDEGASPEDVMVALRERTAVPVSTDTVRRWIRKMEDDAA